MPPYRVRSKNHAGRVAGDMRCGASATVCMTCPIAPAFTSSPAFSVDFDS
jgi:hypothetical protein